MMTVKEMRMKLGLTQANFAKKYSIPKRTIENWEENMSKPPEYVLSLLERVVEMDCK